MTNRTLPQIAKAIKALEKKSIANVVEIGKLLHEALEKSEHGTYGWWLKSEFEWSDQTALNYRSIYHLTQKPNSLDFAKLNLSISAAYFVARMLKENQAATRAVIAAAKKGRVTYQMAVKIFEDYVSDHRPEPEPDDDPPDDDPPDDDLDDDDDDDDTKPLISKLVEELSNISADDSAWPAVIADIGTAVLGKLIRTLQAVFEKHSEISDVKRKADRAENPTARGSLSP